jgi:hypothetical protein
VYKLKRLDMVKFVISVRKEFLELSKIVMLSASFCLNMCQTASSALSVIKTNSIPDLLWRYILQWHFHPSVRDPSSSFSLNFLLIFVSFV